MYSLGYNKDHFHIVKNLKICLSFNWGGVSNPVQLGSVIRIYLEVVFFSSSAHSFLLSFSQISFVVSVWFAKQSFSRSEQETPRQAGRTYCTEK